MKNKLLHLLSKTLAVINTTFKCIVIINSSSCRHMDEEEQNTLVSLSNDYITKITAIGPHKIPVSKKYWSRCLLQGQC